MNPQEKANELYDKLRPIARNMNGFVSVHDVIKASLIVANEVKENIPMYTGELNPKWKFWNDVIEEIKSLKDTRELKTLHLNVNRFWFDKIALGIKTTDYREIKHHWIKLLYDSVDNPTKYDRVEIRNGYSPICPTIITKFIGVRRVPSDTKVSYSDGTVLIPGASFAIDLGEIIEIKNWHGAMDHKIPSKPIFLKDVTGKS